MELVRYLNSTAVRFVELAFGNKVFIPDLVHEVQKRYRFWEIPQGPEQINTNQGLKFGYGRYNGTTIITFSVFVNGFTVQGEAHTDILNGFLDDFIGWSSNKYDLRYKTMKPVDEIFISAVEVKVQPAMVDKLNPFLKLTETLSKMVAAYGITALPYEVVGVIIDTDATVSKPIRTGRFIFERRVETPFESYLFYSSAPVKTGEHLELLKTLEISL